MDEVLGPAITDHVLFVGHVPFQELADIYAASNLNLLPARNQSWGLTPFEALCVDRISIVSSDSGAAEIIRAEGIGLVCEPSPRGIARRILEVHCAPRKFSQLARRGHAYVERELTSTRFAERFAELAASAVKADGEASFSGAAVSEVEMPL